MHSIRLPTFVYKENSKMKNVRHFYKALSVVALSLTFASLAHAAPRTWVSAGGDDGNDCSRANPCKTFAGAISKTDAGGEIDATDPGGFGTVTITKALTIDGGGTFSSILTGGNSAIVINTTNTTDVVTIRNLSINLVDGTGTPGTNGIAILKAGTVHIENCVIFGGTGQGIKDNRGGAANSIFYLYIKDTIVRNASMNGINLNPGAGVFVIASLTNVRSQDNAGAGVALTAGVYASLDHCNLSGNRGDGLMVSGNAGGTEGTANASSAHVEETNSSNNGTSTGAGFHAGNGGFIRLGTSTAYDNTTGLQIDTGGSILSYGHNHISGNSNGNGPPSGMIAEQ
jgi:hypothetical protein